jgi:capping protein beta
MWDLERGFAACFLVKKDVLDQRFVEKGSWNSIHVIEVQEINDAADKTSKKAIYRLTTTVLLAIKVKREELGDLTVDGTLTRQVKSAFFALILSFTHTDPMQIEKTLEYEDHFSHVSNMGRMIEDMEIDMRSSMDGLYIAKTREVINGLRKLQHGPIKGNTFLGELTGAILQHGLKKGSNES